MLVSEIHLFKSNTDNTSHPELPNTENVSFSKGYAKLSLAIVRFKCLEVCYYSFVLCYFSAN